MKKNRLQKIFSFMALISLLLLMAAPIIEAKSRGGSMGGFKGPSRSSGGGGFTRSGGAGPGKYSPGYSGGGGFSMPSLIFVGGGGGGSIFWIIVIGTVIFIVYKKFIKGRFFGNSGSSGGSMNLYQTHTGFYYGKGDFERRLMQLVDSIDTSTNEGLLTLLREMSLLINRNWDSVRWYALEKVSCRNEGELESSFQKLVNQERLKLEKEDVSDIDGREVKHSAKDDVDGLEEAIIFTITVATSEDLKLAKQVTFAEFQKLTQFLSSIGLSQLYGINVTWNILDRDDMLASFPELRSNG